MPSLASAWSLFSQIVFFSLPGTFATGPDTTSCYAISDAL
jgi:hypothetical protein